MLSPPKSNSKGKTRTEEFHQVQMIALYAVTNLLDRLLILGKIIEIIHTL